MRTIYLNLIFCFAGGLFLSCRGGTGDNSTLNTDKSTLEYQKSTEQAEPNQSMVWNRPRTKERQQDRKQMVSEIRRYYNLNTPKILEAMQNVPRHWFVPFDQQINAYVDSPLPIGYDQTISQPFIVAYMTSVLALDPNSRVLEIGTGSGYQAAVLNEFTPHVFSIEIVKPLGERAIEVFKKHEYNTIRVKIGDGYKGWPEYAPFDAIIVTCAPDKIPQPLLEQLKPGGKMIIPVGEQRDGQQLILVKKDPKGKISKRSMMPVRFVPLIREKE